MPVAALIVVAALVITGIIIVPKLRGASQSSLTQVATLAASPLTAEQPTLALLSQNQNTPSPAGTSPIYLYREDFNDAQYDGVLPPNVEADPTRCTNLTIAQEKGSLTFTAPAKTNL